jgi:hypothetical protein
LEGDPYVRDGGLEFLFGYAVKDDDGTAIYFVNWALSRVAEKVIFEQFVDFVTTIKKPQKCRRFVVGAVGIEPTTV